MVEKYEENLWGKINFLHEKAESEHNGLILLSDIIKKFTNAISEFSKAIENIENKKYKIIQDKDSTVYKISHLFKQAINCHLTEFKECSEHIKITVIEPIIKKIDENYIKEKELYDEYNRIKNNLNNCHINLDKAKKEFYSNAKLCEDNIYNYYQLQTLYFTDSNNETAMSKERMLLSIRNTKQLENKYIQNLDETNMTRENEIKKQKELLQFYQKINTDFYSKVKCMITYILPLTKKMYSSILQTFEILEDKCKKVNIQQDINDFIQKNKSNDKPDNPIVFIPYTPNANLDENNTTTGNERKDLQKLDINYHVISVLKDNFIDIRKDINIEEENDKFKLRNLCTKIFKIGRVFQEEEKKELLNFLSEKKFKDYFLLVLSRQRTKSRFKRTKTLIKDLSDILNYILEHSEKEKDFGSARSCIILSQTFYYEINNKKKYIYHFIKNNKWLKTLEFWEGLIEYMIQQEIASSQEMEKNNKIIEKEESIREKRNNIIFSQLITFCSVMIDFTIKKVEIKKISEFFVKKYELDKTFTDTLDETIKNLPDEIEDDSDLCDEQNEKDFKIYKSQTSKNLSVNKEKILNEETNNKNIIQKEQTKKEEDKNDNGNNLIDKKIEENDKKNEENIKETEENGKKNEDNEKKNEENDKKKEENDKMDEENINKENKEEEEKK